MRKRLLVVVAIGVLVAAPAPASAGDREAAVVPAVQSLLGADPAACERAARAQGGVGLAICPTGPAKPITLQAGIDAPIWLPSWCYSKPQGAWHNERFDACGILVQDWGVVRYPDGARVGSFRLTEYHYSGTLPYSNGWVQQAGFEMSNRSGNTAGIEMHSDSGCYWGTCRLESVQFPSPQQLTSNPRGTANFRMDLGWGHVAAGQTYIRYQLFKPDAFPSPIIWSVPWQVRCDNNTAGTPGFGCVFPLNHIPSMEYWRWGEYSELARHIQEAQQSGLPGAHPGTGPNSSPLTRLTDDGLQELNRTFACLGSYPRPPGKSCDEYPFASTWQGAYTSGSTTAARTRDWCQIAEPISSGPYGWSVCMVDEWQNSAGGSALGAWYLANRVISGDQFYVHIT